MKRGNALSTAALCAASISVFVWLASGLIKVSSPTYDEPVHLASGYGYLVSSAPGSLNYLDHPALGEVWDALPLLFLKPSPDFDRPDWTGRYIYDYADLFLYKNRIAADRLLNTARLGCALGWSLLLSIAIILWSLRIAGPVGAIAAAFLFAFCPPLVAHLSLTTTDAPSSVFYFLTFWILSIRPRRAFHWLLAGTTIGLALASKFNMVVLPAYAAALLITERVVSGRRKPAAAEAAALAAASLAFVTVMLAVYRFHGLSLYWKGLISTFARVNSERPSFLMGRYSMNGNLLYFPMALALKTPLPLLGFAAIGTARRLRLLAADWREKIAIEQWLIVPPVLYFVPACFSRMLLGQRHILPVYPFLIVLAASGAAWTWTRGVRARVLTLAAGLWLVIGVLRVHPYQLAYFNELAGGPARGYRYLVESNLDWGQDLPTLAEKLREIGNPPIVLLYMGVGDPSYYGLRYAPLGTMDVSRRDGVVEPTGAGRVLFAVSATHLQFIGGDDREAMAWLRSRKPIFTAGYSIFVYDLTEDPDGARRLAGMLLYGGYPRLAKTLLTRYGAGNRTSPSEF